MTERRRSLSTRERKRLFDLHGGICHICKQTIDGVREAWDIEHVIPWAITRDDSDENRKPAHRGGKCHGEKTKRDIKTISKSNRVRANHIGARAPSRNPIPGSRNTRFKKKLDGTVEYRD